MFDTLFVDFYGTVGFFFWWSLVLVGAFRSASLILSAIYEHIIGEVNAHKAIYSYIKNRNEYKAWKEEKERERWEGMRSETPDTEG